MTRFSATVAVAFALLLISSSRVVSQQFLVLVEPINGVAVMSAQVGATASTNIWFTNIGLAEGTVSVSGFDAREFSGSADSVINIAVGDTVGYAVTFTPNHVGTVYDTISISGNLGTVFIVLMGNGTAGDDGSFAASPAGLNFGSIQTGSEKVMTVVVTNTSVNEESFLISGLKSPEYSFASETYFALNAGESSQISVRFKPQTDGEYMDSLVIANGTNTQVILTDGWGTTISDSSRAFIVSATNIDFGTVQIGNSVKQTITVTSTLNAQQVIAFRLANGQQFSTDQANALSLGVLATGSIDVNYQPNATGDHTDTLILTNGSEVINVILNGRGEGQSFFTWELQPDILYFGPGVAGDEITETATVTNKSANALTITNATLEGPDAADFEFVNPPAFPLTIAGLSALSLNIKTTLRNDMNVSRAWLRISTNSDSKQSELITIYDSTVIRPDTIKVRVENTSGVVGGTARVVVTLLSDLPSDVTRGEITYQFNASVMALIDAPLASSNANGMLTVSYSFTPEGSVSGQTLTSQLFTLTLGDAESTPVSVVSLKLFNEVNSEKNLKVYSNDALVSVEDAAGRTVNANNAGLWLQLNPNPATTEVLATYKSITIPTQFAIFNSMGMLVADVTNLIPETLEGEVSINLDALASGTYLVRLSSGNLTLVRTLVKY